MPGDNDPSPHSSSQEAEKKGLLAIVKDILRAKPDPSFRETIEEYIDIPPHEEPDSTAQHERALLSNILKLRDVKVVDIMIPRANMAAIEIGTTQAELLALLAEKQYSRIVVYRGTLDDVLGTIHIKDVVAALAKGEEINIRSMITEIPIVSPAMPVFDLMLEMRNTRRHMVLVVDEYGGIDGLVTIGDLIESIIGEIEDEHDSADNQPQLVEKPDGSIVANAQMDIDSFENRIGPILSEEEREECDTLGGLVFGLAGRVPARGEVLTHGSGIVFEILDADARRINRLRIRNLPQRAAE